MAECVGTLLYLTATFEAGKKIHSIVKGGSFREQVMDTQLIQFIVGSLVPTIDKAATSVSIGNQQSCRTFLSVTSKEITGEGTATG